MHRNKLTLILLFTLLCSLTLQGQKKFRPSLNLSGADEELWNFGVMFGNYPESSQDWLEGFNVRLVAERNLIERLDFRMEPGIIFEKLLPQNSVSLSLGNEESSTEIQLPLLLKYSANRVGNANPFIIAGYQPALIFTEGKIAHYLEAGLGFDFYLRKSKAALHLRLNKHLSPSTTSGVFIGLSVETRDGWKLYKQ